MTDARASLWDDRDWLFAVIDFLVLGERAACIEEYVSKPTLGRKAKGKIASLVERVAAAEAVPKGRLRINPEPIKTVPDAQREVWTRSEGFRCDHEDARGRCASRETKSVLLGRDPIVVGHYCERHFDKHAVLLPEAEEDA